ncbi:hypothetical protein L0F63_002737 [Massospora cicadina]|nr:hypothetical protein L0F63_002737 [Massospora cicadina]
MIELKWIGWLVVGVLGARANPKFTKVVALGDSISDTGRVFNLTGGRIPAEPYYAGGRFSNGKTWIEYVANHYGAALESYAHGQATTDSEVYQVQVGSGIPGCVQQADNLRRSSYPDKVLLSMAFFGNDFFVPGATQEKYFDNLLTCLDKVIKSKAANHIIIPTNFAPEAFPSSPPSTTTPARSFSLQPTLWREHPNLHLYGFDFKAAILDLRNNGLKYCKGREALTATTTCLKFTPFQIPEGAKPCSNPNQFVFHDPLHPTTKVHEAIANSAIATINDASPTCFDPEPNPGNLVRSKLIQQKLPGQVPKVEHPKLYNQARPHQPTETLGSKKQPEFNSN